MSKRPLNIRRLRLRLHLTQVQFASRLNVSRWSVMRWERGETQPHPIFVERIVHMAADQQDAITRRMHTQEAVVKRAISSTGGIHA